LLKGTRMHLTLKLSLILALFALFLIMPAGVAIADSAAHFRVMDLPESLRYRGSDGASAKNGTSLQYQHQKQQLRLIEAPTRYRTRSILRYSHGLGDSGLVLRIKAPLKSRQLVRFELRF
jgi:hypothetical protein